MACDSEGLAHISYSPGASDQLYYFYGSRYSSFSKIKIPHNARSVMDPTIDLDSQNQAHIAFHSWSDIYYLHNYEAFPDSFSTPIHVGYASFQAAKAMIKSFNNNIYI